MTIRELIYKLLEQEDIDTEVEVVEENNIIFDRAYKTKEIADFKADCVDDYGYSKTILVIRSDKNENK